MPAGSPINVVSLCFHVDLQESDFLRSMRMRHGIINVATSSYHSSNKSAIVMYVSIMIVIIICVVSMSTIYRVAQLK